MQRVKHHLLHIFLTGLLTALPLVVTVAIVVWTVRTLHTWLGPQSLVGGLLVALGLDVFESELLSYLIGLGLVLAAIFLLGLLVQTRLKHWITLVTGRVMARIPVVGSLYDLLRRLVDLLSRRDAAGTRSMTPVWLHFGGPGQTAAVLGLLSTPEPVLMNGEPCVGVLVPTAPVPVGGALVYVPQAWVRPAELGVEALTSIYVSMGVTSSQYLPRA